MKKIVIFVIAAVFVAAYFVVSKTSDETDVAVENEEESLYEKTETDEEACAEAIKANSRAVWEKYLREFPEGKCAEEAKEFLDKSLCEKARENNRSYYWENYLEDFPEGKCAGEADKFLCDEAKQDNSRAGWEKYLKNSPKGICGEEARAFKAKYKKIGNLEWSDLSGFGTDYCEDCSWEEAKSYCEKLEEDGLKDWRLPTVDEFKILVENCSEESEKKGSCLFTKMNGDVEGIWAYSDDESAVWYADKNGIYRDKYPSTRYSVRCVRQDEHDACETARKYDLLYYWIFYFENFPNGECAAEAKAALEKEDEKACLWARKENTRASWEHYLKTFPDGKCAEEGKSVRNKFKKIGGLEWSDLSPKVIFFSYVLEDYCGNLSEDGHDDWGLPDIEDLRMLVQNHSATIADGSCDEYKIYPISDNCRGENGNNFSKLGDKVKILSSSYVQGYMGKYLDGLGLDFSNGGIFEVYDKYSYFRCVRIVDNDMEACNSVRKDPSFHAWSLYLRKFPNGKCAKAAKEAMDKISCKKAVSSSDWKNYLKEFPDGKCAAEAKMIIEVNLCSEAKEESSRAGWEAYLRERDFPFGRCSYEGKIFVNQYRKIGGLEWSDVSVADDGYFSGHPRYSQWEAEDYCVKLEEGGHKDWRLPTVDELKMLIRNCPKTDLEKYEIESYEVNEKSEEGDSLKNICFYSRLQGDYDGFGLWAYQEAEALSLYADIDGIHEENPDVSCYGDEGCHSVRCVRQEDDGACKTAKKYNTQYFWSFYLENYSDGECVKEAKAFLEKIDRKACTEAEKANTRENWQSYLGDFPEGGCTAEAKAFLDKSACEKARENNDLYYWEHYLEDFPEGQCVAEAKVSLDKLSCEIARESNDLYYWRSYLKDFPEGQCAAEAKAAWKEAMPREDKSSCENARKNESYYNWKHYLENYPDGKCVKEAKAFLERIDRKACAEAKKANTRENWQSYLKDFPEGICSAEAKVFLDKYACELAKEKSSRIYWQYYLEKFPDGQCATEAKEFLGKEPAKDDSISQTENLKKNGNPEWSDRSRKAMN